MRSHERTDEQISFSGVGGHDMEREGIRSLFPIDELAIVGIDAVIAKLPMILRRIRETAAAVIAANPDVLVIIDSPDFTHRVARKVRAAAPHIRIVDYVSPSVWAWRPGRAKAMRRYVDHVLALLPFEPAAHAAARRSAMHLCRSSGGGDRRDGCGPSAEEATPSRRRAADLCWCCPEAASGEVRRMLPVFAEAVHLAAKTAPFEIVLPTVPHLVQRITEATGSWQIRPRIVVDQEEKWAAFRIARAALGGLWDGDARACGRGSADHRGVQDFAAGRSGRAPDDKNPDHRARQSRARRKRDARDSPARRDAGEASRRD